LRRSAANDAAGDAADRSTHGAAYDRTCDRTANGARYNAVAVSESKARQGRDSQG
jgi:hypothetical protein